jgi:hypothetical protein
MSARPWIALAAALVAGILAAVACAVVLGIIDIYLAGHGHPILGRPWIERAFLRMSRADVILVGVSSVAAGLAARLGWVAAGKTPEGA